LGCQKAVELIPEVDTVFNRLSQVQGVDILSPFLSTNVTKYDCSELAADYSTLETPTLSPTEHPMSQAYVPYMHKGNFEDAMAEEMPRHQITSEIIIAGQKMTKAKALCHQMMYQTGCASTDRLKHVQHIPCFNPGISPELKSSTIISSNDPLGTPCLHIGNPIATLVCEGHVFLAVAQVNQLQFASKNDLHKIAVHLLAVILSRVV
jgi:hypothetical protein